MFSAAIKSGAAGSPKDPQFNYVTMLLHSDGSASGNTTVTPFNSDASTNNFNVTINGDARSSNFTPYQGNGYYSNYINGAVSGAYLQAASSSATAFGTGNFTIEMWLNSGTQSNTRVSGNGNGSGWVSGKWVFATSTSPNPTKFVFACNNYANNADMLVSTTNSNDNLWHHIAIVRNGNVWSLYVDGVSESSITSSVSLDNGTANPIGIGYSMVAGDVGYTGYISNFRMSNTAVYTSNFTPSTMPLTAISGTQLLTCQSNRLIDNSTNAIAITPALTTSNPFVQSAQPFTLPSSVATYGSGYFDGSGDYLTTPSTGQFAPSGDFTISCWYYPTSTRAYQQIIGNFNGSASTVWIFEITSGTGINFYTNGITPRISGSGLVINAWNYLVLARSGSTITGYVNGVSLGTYSQSGIFGSSTQSISIGRGGSSSAAGDISLGYIADVKLIDGSAVTTIPTTPQTATTGTQLLTTQYNGGGNNNGFKDSSRNNFVVTRAGNTTQGTFTPYGSNWSNYFDGTGDYFTGASTSGQLGASDFTVEAFIYPVSRVNSFPTIFGNYSAYAAGSLAIFAGHNSGNTSKYQVAINGAGFPTIQSTDSIVYNQWTHIALVRSGSTITLYLNGVANGTYTSSATLNGTSGLSYIGSAGDELVNGCFNGYISNLRVVKGTAVYTAAFTPPTSPLTAITNTSLLTCQSNRFIDSSVNSFVMTPNGPPSVQRFSPFSPTNAYSTSVIGGSGYFDGSGDYLSIPSNAAFQFGSGNFTVECWAYMNSAAQQFLICQWNTPNKSWALLLRNSGTTLSFVYSTDGSNETSIDGTIAAQPSRWAHFAAVRNGNTLTTYMNGVVVGTGSMTGVTLYSASQAVEIGRNTEATSTWNFSGYMVDARVAKSAIYTSAFTPPTTPLTPTLTTQLLLNTTNAGIFDNAMMNDLETVGNAMVSTSVKKFGIGSMYFDGTGDYLTSPLSLVLAFGSGDFTVECWVYATNTSALRNIIGNYNGTVSTASFVLQMESTGRITGGIYSGSSFIGPTSTASISATTWTHLAVVRNGTSIKLYINGTNDGSTTSSSVANTPVGTFSVGAEQGNYNWNGYIDELRITKGYARYTANFTAPTSAFPNN